MLLNFGGIGFNFGIWQRFGEALELRSLSKSAIWEAGGAWRDRVGTGSAGGAWRDRVGTASFQKGAGFVCGYKLCILWCTHEIY